VKVLSLFDGISCGRIALERAGIEVDKYYASEIDKYATKISEANYPDIIRLGDVTKWREWDIEKPDLLIAGFPCQSWSVAGRQKGDNDPRGALVHDLIDIWKHYDPKYFMFENVKMKKSFIEYVNSLFGVEPIEINSALVSAQNRRRLYWTNIPNVTQPVDRGLLLKDIIEDGMPCATYNRKDGATKAIEKAHCISASDWRGLNRNQNQTAVVDRDKSYCIDANYFKGGNLKSYFEKHRRQLVFSKDGLCHVGDADLKGNESIKRVYHVDGKNPTLTTMGGGHREPKILCGAWRGRYVVDGKRQDHKMKTAGLTEQRLEVREDGKTNTLTTVQKDNNVVAFENLSWRKLTPLECERLQTLPDNYTNHVSNTQRYKSIGNGWTVDVIAHIFKGLKS
jgi:site-specific DNA-cytosine methylase